MEIAFGIDLFGCRWIEIGGRQIWNWFDAKCVFELGLDSEDEFEIELEKILVWMLIIAGDKEAVCDNVDPRRSCRVDAARCI